MRIETKSIDPRERIACFGRQVFQRFRDQLSVPAITVGPTSTERDNFVLSEVPFRLTRITEDYTPVAPKILIPLDVIRQRVNNGEIAHHRGLYAYRDLFLASRELDLTTEQAYSTTLEGMIRFLASAYAITTPEPILPEHLAEYSRELSHQGLLGNDMHSQMRRIRSFIRFLREISEPDS